LPPYALDQPQPLQACVPVLADDDVLLELHAERLGDGRDPSVISMSADEGVGSLEGWLCTREGP
jgi:hypothetical protein